MTTEPTPKHIAHAIADLAHPKVVTAWRYLDTWAALEAGGVPPAQRRDVMGDTAHVDTEALEQVRGWTRDDERGMVVLHGAQDCGKTYAAAWWALSRHERGLATMWISAAKWGRLTFDEIRPMLRRAERAAALVIDDAGCGESQGDHFKRTMEALFLERDQRPTLVTGNLNKTEMKKWLGPRIISRLEVCGADVHFEHTLKMRKRDMSAVDPDTGRGEDWHRAAELVGMLGCERGHEAVTRTEYDDEGGQWEQPTGEYRERFDVGRVLEVKVTRASADKEARAACMAATKLAGLDDRKVWAHAAKLVGTVSDLDSSDVLDKLVAKMAEQMTDLNKAAAAGRRADNEYRAKVCYDTLEEQATRGEHRSTPGSSPNPNKAPDWTKGSAGVKAMQGQGYFVRPRTDGFDLYRKRKDAGDLLVIKRATSVAEAWQACRLLWGSGW